MTEPAWLTQARSEGRITEGRPASVALDIDRIHKTPKKPSKFLNRKVKIDGHTFDSQKEANRYTELTQLLKLGMIADLRLQVAFPIVVNGVTVCKYVADFVYAERLNGDEFGEVIEDVKSAFTRKNPVYRLKKKLLEASTGKKIRET